MEGARAYLSQGTTLKQTLLRALHVYAHRNFTDDMTYAEVLDKVASWSEVLSSRLTERGTMIAIVGDNNADWVMTDFAATLAR